MGSENPKVEDTEYLFMFDLMVHEFSVIHLNIAPRATIEDFLIQPPLFTVAFCSPVIPCLEISQDDFKDDLCMYTTETKDMLITYFSRGVTAVTAATPREMLKYVCHCPGTVKMTARWKETGPEYVGSGSVEIGDLLQSLLVNALNESFDYRTVVSRDFNLEIENECEIQGTLKFTLKLSCYGKTVTTGFHVDQEKGQFVLKQDVGKPDMFDLKPCPSPNEDPDLKFQPVKEKKCTYAKIGAKEYPAVKYVAPVFDSACLETEEGARGDIPERPNAGDQWTQPDGEDVQKERTVGKSKEVTLEYPERKDADRGRSTIKNGGHRMAKRMQSAPPARRASEESKQSEKRGSCDCRPKKKDTKSAGDHAMQPEAKQDVKTAEPYSTRMFVIDELTADIYGKVARLRMRTETVTITEEDGSNASDDGLSGRESRFGGKDSRSLLDAGKELCIHNLARTRKNTYLPAGYTLGLIPRRVNMLVKEIRAIKKKELEEAKQRQMKEEEHKKREKEMKALAGKPPGMRALILRNAELKKKLAQPPTEEVKPPKSPATVHFNINNTECKLKLGQQYDYEVKKPEETGDEDAPVKLQISRKERPKSPSSEIVSSSSYEMVFRTPLDAYGGKEKRRDMALKRLQEFSKNVQVLETDFPPPEKGGKGGKGDKGKKGKGKK